MATRASCVMHERHGGHFPDCVHCQLHEALALLAVWFSRWQGHTAGTPDGLPERTRGLLAARGRAPQEAARQGADPQPERET